MSGPSSARGEKIPVNVLTGFLGSGKTTLLRRLLDSAAFSNCAVLINELGEIALDHELVDVVDQETIVLSSGCICCGIRTDLADALLDLHEKRDRGIIPAFDRVVVETTGLADPVPVLNTIIGDPKLRFHYRAGTVVATVDAVHGLQQLERQAESVKQAAVADRLVMTKVDLSEPAVVDELQEALRVINPIARIIRSRNDVGEAEILVCEDAEASGATQEVAHWFVSHTGGNAKHFDDRMQAAQNQVQSPSAHASHISTVSLVFDEPLDWAAFGVWFSMLLHRHGERILRVKGILNIAGSDQPTVVHGVQHLIHPPSHLPRWPSADQRSRLVLIGDLPSAASLQQSFARFTA